jgi:hypothetical protein
MAERTRLAGVVGLFDDEDSLLAAARRVREAGWRRWDCHVPHPVHGLSDAMGLPPSRMGWIAIGAGAVGVASALLMQWWMSAVDYPVRIGGKPLASWPAFVPITFELFVLFAAFAITGGLIRMCRLWRWHHPLHDSGVMAEVSSRRFAIVLDARDDRFDRDGSRFLLEEAGCTDVRDLVEEDGEDAAAAPAPDGARDGGQA